eukprot:2287512-Rhodomonas_salina.2
MTECQTEISNVLRRKGVPILFPFPVPEKSRQPGEWIAFERFREHPAIVEESWITNRCTSLVWHFGFQGWYILTGQESLLELPRRTVFSVLLLTTSWFRKRGDPWRVPGDYEPMMGGKAALTAHQPWRRSWRSLYDPGFNSSDVATLQRLGGPRPRLVCYVMEDKDNRLISHLVIEEGVNWRPLGSRILDTFFLLTKNTGL